nr:serine/arginine repetitive matrix protein 1 isoform X1 [Aegilops tauschii subsp. strangulata]
MDGFDCCIVCESSRTCRPPSSSRAKIALIINVKQLRRPPPPRNHRLYRLFPNLQSRAPPPRRQAKAASVLDRDSHGPTAMGPWRPHPRRHALASPSGILETSARGIQPPLPPESRRLPAKLSRPSPEPRARRRRREAAVTRRRSRARRPATGRAPGLRRPARLPPRTPSRRPGSGCGASAGPTMPSWSHLPHRRCSSCGEQFRPADCPSSFELLQICCSYMVLELIPRRAHYDQGTEISKLATIVEWKRVKRTGGSTTRLWSPAGRSPEPSPRPASPSSSVACLQPACYCSPTPIPTEAREGKSWWGREGKGCTGNAIANGRKADKGPGARCESSALLHAVPRLARAAEPSVDWSWSLSLARCSHWSHGPTCTWQLRLRPLAPLLNGISPTRSLRPVHCCTRPRPAHSTSPRRFPGYRAARK